MYFQVSTPHGGLATQRMRKEEMERKSFNSTRWISNEILWGAGITGTRVSTPHGGLATPKAGKRTPMAYKSFNSTRWISNQALTRRKPKK